jgi:Domain of unknown function (DUF397)
MVVGGWRKSSYSGNNGGDCVEVGYQDTDVAVRDTKDGEGSVLLFTPETWRRFATRLKERA